ALENHLRKRLRRRMRDAQRNTLHSQRRRHLRRLSSQRNCRPTAALPHHFHIHPPHPARPPRPQRLHRRFLRRKPPRVPLILVLELLAILSLPRSIHASQERLSMPLDGRLHPLHFRNINPHPNNHAASNSPKLSAYLRKLSASALSFSQIFRYPSPVKVFPCHRESTTLSCRD